MSKTNSFFLNFSVFFKCALNSAHFQKKKKKKNALIADVFPKLQTPKNLIRYMSERSIFRGPFDKQIFINTLTADDKYSLLNRDNLMQPIQMHLCQKEKDFFPFFLYIFEISGKF